MIYVSLFIFGVVLLIGLAFAYPWIQRRREDELARRLDGMKDPASAMLEVDLARDVSRGEAGFFKAIIKSLSGW